MARKTKKQQDAQAAVQARMTGPVRVDASAVQTGGERGSTKSVSGIHPSLEGSTQAMSEAGIQGGEITTSGGTQVRVARPKTSKGLDYKPQAPEFGNPGAPPVKEGVSQKFTQQIGREHGRAKAAELSAEADAVAQRPNPLRSDGLVDTMVMMHSPSVGGNSLGHGGGLSAMAKADAPGPRGSNRPTGGRDTALNALGYTDPVQNRMLDVARDRISRRQGKGQSPALSSTEITSRAHGQVQEHLDEALHGTKRSHTDRLSSNILDLQESQASGARGYGIETLASEGTPAPGASPKKRQGMGMTAPRTPIQTAQRKAVSALVRQPGGWHALKDADAVHEASSNHLQELNLRQKARRAMDVSPEDRNTMSPGSDPEARARSQAQPVFSTSNPGVGVPSEPKKKVRPATSAPGSISPIPSNLPSGPDVGGQIGRDASTRRKKEAFSGGIAAYEASRPAVTPKGTKSNVAVAQTSLPEPMAANPMFAGSGMAAARSQNVQLGQRGPAGPRAAFKQIR